MNPTKRPTKAELKAARERHFLTQDQCAELVSASRRAWQKWEHETEATTIPLGVWWLFLLRLGEILPGDLPEPKGRARLPVARWEFSREGDTGNGAIRTIETSPAYPGIERVTVRSYCGRSSDNCRYYRLASDTSRTFDTLAQAFECGRERRRGGQYD